MVMFKAGDVVKPNPDAYNVEPDMIGVVREIMDTEKPVLVQWGIYYTGMYSHEDLAHIDEDRVWNSNISNTKKILNYLVNQITKYGSNLWL
jgi:hypothetical protein